MREIKRNCGGIYAAAETAEQSADHHADVAHFIYVDSHRIGRHRMLADRTDTKAERRFEQDKPGNKGKCYCKNRRIIDIRKEDLSQDGNIAQTGDFRLIKRLWNFVCLRFAVDQFDDK